MMRTAQSAGGRLSLILATLLLAAAATGCRVNPVTGRKQLIFFNTGDELKLGDSYHPNIIFTYDGEYLDGELKRYLGSIVIRLRNTSHRPQMRTDLTVLNSSIYNAFAIPGHVYCTRGFLAELQNEAQFAAVMGHELGHVTALHTANQMTTNLLTVAGAALTQELAGEPEIGRGVLTAGQVGLTLLGLSYSREQERQADRLGTYYMALAGWDPRQAVAMQRLLSSLGEHQPGLMDRYLSTHPRLESRLQEIQNLIREKNLLERGLIQGDGVFEERWGRHTRELRRVNEDFTPHDRGIKLLREGKHAEALQEANEALSRRRDQAPFHRLRGDALLELGRAEEARSAYRQALEVDPRYAPAETGLGMAAMALEEFGEAESHFARAAHDYPAALQAHYGLGVARVRLGKFQEAIPPLQQVTSALPEEPMPHYLLALCYDQTGRPTRAAEHYRRALQAGLEGEAASRARQRLSALQPDPDAQSDNQ